MAHGRENRLQGNCGKFVLTSLTTQSHWGYKYFAMTMKVVKSLYPKLLNTRLQHKLDCRLVSICFDNP